MPLSRINSGTPSPVRSTALLKVLKDSSTVPLENTSSLPLEIIAQLANLSNFFAWTSYRASRNALAVNERGPVEITAAVLSRHTTRFPLRSGSRTFRFSHLVLSLIGWPAAAAATEFRGRAFGNRFASRDSSCLVCARLSEEAGNQK